MRAPFVCKEKSSLLFWGPDRRRSGLLVLRASSLASSVSPESAGEVIPGLVVAPEESRV